MVCFQKPDSILAVNPAHCLFSPLVAVRAVLIGLFKWTRLRPAISACSVKAQLNIFSFSGISACSAACCTRPEERRAQCSSPFQCVWVWLSCCWMPRRGKCWISADCPFVHCLLATTNHSSTSYSEILSMGTARLAGVTVTHSTTVSCG